MKNKKLISLLLVCLMLIVVGTISTTKKTENQISEDEHLNESLDKNSLYENMADESFLFEAKSEDVKSETHMLLVENYSGDIPAENIVVQIEYERIHTVTLVAVEGVLDSGEYVSGWVKKSAYDNAQEKIADGTIEELPPHAVYYLLNENGSTMINKNHGPATMKLSEAKAIDNGNAINVEMSEAYNYTTTLEDLLSGSFKQEFEFNNDSTQKYVITLWVDGEPVKAEDLGISFDILAK